MQNQPIQGFLRQDPVAVLEPTKYCLYARKSTEQDERQALSIDSQIKEMLEMANREGLNIVEVRKESHSAKASGARPVFNELINDIRSNKFNGILTWAPDRLSRNAGDLGSLVDLMDQKLLHQIRTHGQMFSNNPNEKFLLMILCSQAKLENDNKSINVKRGLRAKLDDDIKRLKSLQNVLGITAGNESIEQVDVRSYAKHIIKHGSVIDKRELLGCLKSRLVLQNKKLILTK